MVRHVYLPQLLRAVLVDVEGSQLCIPCELSRSLGLWVEDTIFVETWFICADVRLTSNRLAGSSNACKVNIQDRPANLTCLVEGVALAEGLLGTLEALADGGPLSSGQVVVPVGFDVLHSDLLVQTAVGELVHDVVLSLQPWATCPREGASLGGVSSR